MSRLYTTFGLSFIFLVLIILRKIIRAAVDPLRSIPGPRLARFTRLWSLSHVYKRDFHVELISLHRKYGPIVRIAPGNFSIDDPAAVRTLYGPGTAFVKSSRYDATGDPSVHIPDLFTDREPKRHAVNRRKVANLYSMTTLLRMEQDVDKCVAMLEERFTEFCRSEETINLEWWLQCYAFDVIGAISINRRFGFLEKGEDPLNLIAGLRAGIIYTAYFGVIPEFHKALFSLLGLFGGGPLQKTFDFTDKQVENRQKELRAASIMGEVKASDNDDFLTKLLHLHHEEPNTFPEALVQTVIKQNIGAGSDTTGITLTAIMCGLMQNPKSLHKLRQEIDEAYSTGTLSTPSTFAEAQKLPYLQAVLKESLRTHAATGFPFGRIVPEGGAEICGRRFPQGTEVGISSWVAHYNRDVFGDNADFFNPERWLGDPEEVRALDRYWIPFGHGSRTCIGKNISIMEISKLIPVLVHNFNFELVERDGGIKIEYMSFVKQKDVWVKITKRSLRQ